MPHQSPYPDLNLQQSNILSYCFAGNRGELTQPLWLDAANPSNSLSLKQMLLYIKRFAMGLSNLSIPEGKPIMVFSPNHIFVTVAYLGAAGSKRIFSGANPGYTSSEVAYQMRNLDAGAVFVHPELLTTAVSAAKEANIPRDRLFLFSDTRQKERNGVKDWRDMLVPSSEAESWQWDPLEGDAARRTISCINFSSGTTGLPKGVCITHANLIANASQAIFNKFYGQSTYSEDNPGKESWLGFLPLYHAYSQLFTINIACRLKTVPVYVLSKFIYADFLAAIQRYKITALQAVPPVLVMLAKRPETKDYDVSSLQHILVGAAPTSSDLQNEVSQRFGIAITQAWGMTETTCCGAMVPYSEKDLSGSIGSLIPNTQARLVDEEGKDITEEGRPGELFVRGPQILFKYWKNPSATKESKDADGWFRTGDVAITKKGRWWIVDRKKELIKVKGLQVAPAELEAALLESDVVADAAAVGVPFDGEELPRAYVVLQETARGKTTEKDVQKFVEGRLSRHKWLTGGVAFVDEIPKLPSGKILRKVMKEWAKRDGKALKGRLTAKL